MLASTAYHLYACNPGTLATNHNITLPSPAPVCGAIKNRSSASVHHVYHLSPAPSSATPYLLPPVACAASLSHCTHTLHTTPASSQHHGVDRSPVRAAFSSVSCQPCLSMQPGLQASAQQPVNCMDCLPAARHHRHHIRGHTACFAKPRDDDEEFVPKGEVRRMKMVIAYDGSAYSGYQWQAPPKKTVQAELEKAAGRLYHLRSRMVGASRTDGGAHALGQVVHFDMVGVRDDLETDVMYFNGFLPADIKVLSIGYAEEAFDSHFSSLGKTYQYKISTGIPDPTQAKYSWWVYDRWCERMRGKPQRMSDLLLDVPAMQEAAEKLLGKHDFSAFMDKKRPAGMGNSKKKRPRLADQPALKPQRDGQKNTRILCEAHVRESRHPITGSQEVTLEVTGNGFLFRMVRMLAAGLVEVGAKRMTAQQLYDVLKSADRSALPEAAPPHGLYLCKVYYPSDEEFWTRSSAVTELWDELKQPAMERAMEGLRKAREARLAASQGTESSGNSSDDVQVTTESEEDSLSALREEDGMQ